MGSHAFSTPGSWNPFANGIFSRPTQEVHQNLPFANQAPSLSSANAGYGAAPSWFPRAAGAPAAAPAQPLARPVAAVPGVGVSRPAPTLGSNF